jgi:hypothetical protein
MDPFVRLSSVVVPLDRVNVDTDQIIPKQFLKRIERTGFGQFLFNDWRYLPDGKPKLRPIPVQRLAVPARRKTQPGLHPEPAGVSGRKHPRGRAQLRLGVLA